MISRVGAPIGGRVHWFLWNLPRTIKQAYEVDYDYEYHNYRLTRWEKRTLIDEFLVVRTSRRCWRVMYYHHGYKDFKYFSARTSRLAGQMVCDIYLKAKKAENLTLKGKIDNYS